MQANLLQARSTGRLTDSIFSDLPVATFSSSLRAVCLGFHLSLCVQPPCVEAEEHEQHRLGAMAWPLDGTKCMSSPSCEVADPSSDTVALAQGLKRVMQAPKLTRATVLAAL